LPTLFSDHNPQNEADASVCKYKDVMSGWGSTGSAQVFLLLIL
jgi:hypothetical protein